MENEIPIVILNHGKFGEELIHSAELIVGQTTNVKAISLLQGTAIEEYYEIVKHALLELEGEAIVLTDMFGGTPSNIALMLQKERRIRILCGVNLPMLLELLVSREVVQPIGQLLEKAVSAARNAIYQPKEISLEELD